MCPGWWASAQDPWTWVFVEGCDCGGMWLSRPQKHPEKATCMLWGRRPTRWGFQDLFYGSSVNNLQEPWQTDTLGSHTKDCPRQQEDICARERYPCPTLTLCPAAPAHENICQMDLLWLFRAWGYPGRACYFIVSLLWELLWFQSRAFKLLKFTVTTE